VSNLLSKVNCVYEFLLEGDTLGNLITMKDAIERIARVISDCADFIVNYSKKKSFCGLFRLLPCQHSDLGLILAKRLGKNILSETQTVVTDHINALDDLMQQYRDHAIRDTHVNVHRGLEDSNLDGIPYADDVGLKLTKKCLDGTRMEILQEIDDWIHNTDDNAPRIFWLHGQAGKGKSTIAHTVALRAKDRGELGSCFCFTRDRQKERLENKMLSTIARDLADRDPTFRRALAIAIKDDNALRTTTDVMLQWTKLLLEPLKVSGGIVGSVVLVIDALDESNLDSLRAYILPVLKSLEAASLPSNFRILLTSRPLSDIKAALRYAQHVKATSLDDVPATFTERDIRLYVSEKVEDFRGIGEREIEDITLKANGLFEWARLACEFIRPRAGEASEERFDGLMARTSGEGATLLDSMYHAILDSAVGRKPQALTRFRSMMQQILCTLEPLPMDALHAMRLRFPHEHDCFDVAIILDYMGSLLGGVTDHAKPIRPLHASFYDFLTEESRSGDYFIGGSDIQADLAIASLRVLNGGLCFNICGLESSYLFNCEVPGLTERIKAKISSHLSYSCCFWVKHLHATKFDPVLAEHVRDLLGSEKILFWFEAMSLLGMLGSAAFSLSYAVRWLQVSRSLM